MLWLLIQLVAFQIIDVNNTQPCFLNYSAGIDMWENCGADEDYIKFSLLGWEWITGGYFSMMVVSVITMATYIKYHKAVYPIIVGIMYLPISYFVFPEVFLNWGIIMAILAACILVYYIITRQTKEYSG